MAANEHDVRSGMSMTLNSVNARQSGGPAKAAAAFDTVPSVNIASVPCARKRVGGRWGPVSPRMNPFVIGPETIPAARDILFMRLSWDDAPHRPVLAEDSARNLSHNFPGPPRRGNGPRILLTPFVRTRVAGPRLCLA